MAAVIEIRRPEPDELPAMARLDGRAFGDVWEPADLERERVLLDLDRFRIAVDAAPPRRAEIVGVAGSYGLEMTVPGGGAVPTGGVTWVGVSVTHRRQGLLRRLMDAVHADIDDRDEPLAALTASEGGIYERFGYGVATVRRVVSIDRRRATIAHRFRIERPGVRIVDHDDPALPDELARRWDRFRRLRAGEIGRSATWFRAAIGRRGAGATWALHDDGFACWKMTSQWRHGHPAHEVEVSDVAGATSEAHAALWQTILALDLAGPVECVNVAPDDALPALLDDPRVVRTTNLNDFVWCAPRDVARCFTTRAYGTDDELVVEVDGRRWRIGPGGCERVRRRPDLVAERSALGALLLGGVAPTALAAARRLEARSPGVLRRADAMLVVHPAPHCTTGF